MKIGSRKLTDAALGYSHSRNLRGRRKGIMAIWRSVARSLSRNAAHAIEDTLEELDEIIGDHDEQ